MSANVGMLWISVSKGSKTDEHIFDFRVEPTSESTSNIDCQLVKFQHCLQCQLIRS